MLFQYLQLELGFTTADQSHALILVAACGLFIKLALLATLVKVLGERWLLVVGLTAYAAEVRHMHGHGLDQQLRSSTNCSINEIPRPCGSS
jgi:hypothetical protein